MAYEKERLFFLETTATRVGYTESQAVSPPPATGATETELPLVYNRQLQRAWQSPTQDNMRATALAFLNTYVSAKNETAQDWIDDPMADGSGTNPDGSPKNKYPGRWHHVGTVWDAASERYVQTLHFRWADTTPETEARYHELIRANQSGQLTVVRKWLGINPRMVERLLSSSNDNPKVLANVVTDPMVDGKLYEGEWLAVSTRGPITEQDGCTIVQTLIKAGDANLTVILGTDKTTSSREVYKWQTTQTDLDAFMNHTGVYATEFDYKWGTSEVGIQKTWQPSENADFSLNLVAKYIVKEPWQYPAASGTPANDFVIVKDFGGIFKESTQQFKNKPTIPIAQAPTNGAQLVKAISNDLAQFDGEILNRVISAGALAGFIVGSSSVYEWNVDKSEVKLPIYTTSTDSSVGQRVSGYNVYSFRQYYYRLVEASVTRVYAASHPNIQGAEATSSIAGKTKGGGVSQVIQVRELAEGLYVTETQDLTIGDWVTGELETTLLYSTTF